MSDESTTPTPSSPEDIQKAMMGAAVVLQGRRFWIPTRLEWSQRRVDR